MALRTSCKNCHAPNASGGLRPRSRGPQADPFFRAVSITPCRSRGAYAVVPQLNEKQVADPIRVRQQPARASPSRAHGASPLARQRAAGNRCSALSTIGCAMCHTPTSQPAPAASPRPNGGLRVVKHMCTTNEGDARALHRGSARQSVLRAVRMGDYSRAAGCRGDAEAGVTTGVGLGLEIPVTTAISRRAGGPTAFTTARRREQGRRGQQRHDPRHRGRPARRWSPRPATGTRACAPTARRRRTSPSGQVAKLTPNEKQSYSITFSKEVDPEHVRGRFTGSRAAAAGRAEGLRRESAARRRRKRAGAAPPRRAAAARRRHRRSRQLAVGSRQQAARSRQRRRFLLPAARCLLRAVLDVRRRGGLLSRPVSIFQLNFKRRNFELYKGSLC